MNTLEKLTFTPADIYNASDRAELDTVKEFGEAACNHRDSVGSPRCIICFFRIRMAYHLNDKPKSLEDKIGKERLQQILDEIWEENKEGFMYLKNK